MKRLSNIVFALVIIGGFTWIALNFDSHAWNRLRSTEWGGVAGVVVDGAGRALCKAWGC
ncbi:hypothetical protein PGB28_09730 [Primorskyibacter aestuariivivens]|uniref:hypothetical protein n=1 Tax=Primorskyibacter aestuariivivens TaxID=1888912 RepID=UPI0022FFE051|nr:hypothetical protein [Primorskyibacter aestuariivivens]MDA7428739.1 hypothetical protein [Primorskyibacter aestuariivivens]